MNAEKEWNQGSKCKRGERASRQAHTLFGTQGHVKPGPASQRLLTLEVSPTPPPFVYIRELQT